MKMLTAIKLTCGLAILFGGAIMLKAENEVVETPAGPAVVAPSETPASPSVIQDRCIQLCQGLESGAPGCTDGCQSNCNGEVVVSNAGFVIAGSEEGPAKKHSRRRSVHADKGTRSALA